MKYGCDLIRDVVTLHSDRVLSEGSERIVAEHLEQCQECRNFYAGYADNAALPTQMAYDPEIVDAAGKIQRYRRGQLWCFGALVGVMLTMLLIWTGMAGVNGLTGMSLIFRGQPFGFVGMVTLLLAIWYPFRKKRSRRCCGWCGWGALILAEFWQFLMVPAGCTVGIDFFGLFSLDIPFFQNIDILNSLDAFNPGFYIGVAATGLLGAVFHRFEKICV